MIAAQEGVLPLGRFNICDQYAIMRDVARTIRQRMGPGPIRWDVLVINYQHGLTRMVGYRVGGSER